MQKDPGIIPLYLSCFNKKICYRPHFLGFLSRICPTHYAFPMMKTIIKLPFRTNWDWKSPEWAAALEGCRMGWMGQALPQCKCYTITHSKAGLLLLLWPPSLYLTTLTTLITLYIVLSCKCCGMAILDSPGSVLSCKTVFSLKVAIAQKSQNQNQNNPHKTKQTQQKITPKPLKNPSGIKHH